MSGMRHKGYLVTRTNRCVEIFPNTTVKASGKLSKFVLRFRNVDPRYVKIWGEESQMYLCMTENGKIYGNATYEKNCRFILHKRPYNYLAFYRKVATRKLFIGFSRSGKPRPGNVKNKRTHFSWKRIRRTTTPSPWNLLQKIWEAP
ncbi:hypothetical protein JTE90_008704 [Oedothorax gibbosus]|uniref:Fibroblast growth factor n=1 Tax=Oedothorax gibbosus TaxID=931172 RepID=A0AAV6V296_9ARAC|nr:hypothetical protein JTE90_008704 [Oedothorax gibbosus]